MDGHAHRRIKEAPPAARGRASRAALAAAAAVVALSGMHCSRARPTPSKEAPWAAPITAEPLPRFERDPKAHPRWSWPAMAHFDATVTTVRSGAQPIRLVRGRLIQETNGERKETDGVVLTIAPQSNTFEIAVELAETEAAYNAARFLPRAGWTLAGAPLDQAAAGQPIAFQRERNGTYDVASMTIRIEPTYVSPGDPPLRRTLDDWAYVAALLSSEPPVYDDAAPQPAGDPDEEIKKALAAGDDARALAIYRSWQPVGRCSMDTLPAEVARDYAELCYRLGKIGCFLQLQVKIMGDRFERVAYSSYGEAAHNTQAERLGETGLDVDRFLRGLALRFAGVTRLGELGGWRLARSIRESGREKSVVPALAQWAGDGGLDEYNRLRAVQVLALMDAEEALDEDGLPEISRMWLDQHREAEKARKP